MKKSIAIIWLLALFAVAHAVCWCEEKNVPLEIAVTEALITPDGVLHCKWKIRNAGKDVVHVYATFLHGSSNDMLDVAHGRPALVRTTWLREVKAYPAYYLPKPEFIDVPPGAEITGSLERRPQAKQKASQLQKLEIVVAYGSDIEQLKSDIQQALAKGTEFQANAVIRWQSLAYSAPVDVLRR
jgi:hypothetical protein